MAERNSGPVAIVAIIAILILIGVVFYFFTGGDFTGSKPTEVNSTTVVTPAASEPDMNAGSSTTEPTQAQ